MDVEEEDEDDDEEEESGQSMCSCYVKTPVYMRTNYRLQSAVNVSHMEKMNFGEILGNRASKNKDYELIRNYFKLETITQKLFLGLCTIYLI